MPSYKCTSCGATVNKSGKSKPVDRRCESCKPKKSAEGKGKPSKKED